MVKILPRRYRSLKRVYSFELMVPNPFCRLAGSSTAGPFCNKEQGNEALFWLVRTLAVKIQSTLDMRDGLGSKETILYRVEPRLSQFVI